MAEPARGTLEIGVTVAGTYAIEGLLGRGGMGAVWLASHVRLPGKKVAIKVLHPDVADEESMARFRREAEIASRLGHPNIVAVHDFNELPDGTPYLVLEYLTGESLQARIARGRMTLNQVVPIIRQIGSALQAAHAEEIVHRDLKPANVFLVPTEAGGDLGEQAKVLDFGISKIRGSQTVKTQDSAILGTPQYMAPEQATGNHAAVDARTDVFALGAIVYEMFAGQPAFRGASIPEVVFKVVYEDPPPLATLVPGLPDDVAAAVHRALAKKQDERFPDVSSFVAALTGTPLTTMRRGAATAPNAPVMPSDALASTEASTGGRRGNIAVVPALASQQLGDPLARTMASGDHRASLAPASVSTAPAVAPASPTAPPVVPANDALAVKPNAPRSGRGKTIAIALSLLAAVGAAVVITMVVMKKDPAAGPQVAAVDPAGTSTDGVGSGSPGHDLVPHDNPPPPVDPPVKPADVVTPPTPATPAAPVDAGVRIASNDSDRPKSGDRPPRPTSGSGSGSDDDDAPADPPAGEDPAVRDLLAEGEAALRGGDSGEALSAAKKAIAKAPRNARAWSLKARAHCAESDMSNAVAAFRNVGGSARRAVIRYCSKHAINLE